MKMENRTFLISGGASGLGKACALEIVHNGGNVAILDMNDDGHDLVGELGSSAKFFVCDVLNTESTTRAVRETAEWAKLVNKPIGGVIPAAGVSTPATILNRDGSPFSLQDVDFVLGVNLRGVLDLVRQAVAEMAKGPEGPDGERGVVIMVASSAAFDGQTGQVSYAASKGAVASMTLPMARDLARFGIRCVTIAPALFETRMTSMMSKKVRESLVATYEFPRRSGQPEEFAGLVKHCIGNVMLNGTVIRLDGGSRPSKI